MKNEIGLVIRIIRQQKLLKQEFVAYKLGITVHAYANIERGRSDINSNRLLDISKILEVKSSQIISLAEKVTESDDVGWLAPVIKTS